MADYTISANMGLVIPSVGVDAGPDWANNLNASLTSIDSHDHSAGRGVQISQSGISISGTFSLNNNRLSDIRNLLFTPQPSITAADSVYVSGLELYYNDGVGNVVQITNNGSVNAGAGSITGLPSGTAGVSYQSVGGTYVFQSATSTPANIDGASIIIREKVASANGITISSPTSLASSYTYTLPTTTPASTALMGISTAGALRNVIPDGTSIAALGAGTSLAIANSAALTGQPSITGSGTYGELSITGAGSGFTTGHVRCISTGSGTNRGAGVYGEHTSATAFSWFSGLSYNATDFTVGYVASASASTRLGAADIANSLMNIDTSGNMVLVGSITAPNIGTPASATASSGSANYTGTTAEQLVANQTLVYTSKTGKVCLMLVGDNGGGGAQYSSIGMTGSTASTLGFIRVYGTAGGRLLNNFMIRDAGTSTTVNMAMGIICFDVAATVGSNEYRVYVVLANAANTISVNYYKLMAFDV